ncbi:MAG: hypothetical protein HYV14_02475 [Elusimicrobia bacterium]|nr:hypothetical protein [Elusimicrobiota bacterium]
MRVVRVATGSFCDAERTRLGRSSRYARIETAALELARRGLGQEHRVLVATPRASVEDLLENLYRLVRLTALCGEGFTVAAVPAPRGAADPLVRACLARVAGAAPVGWLEELARVLLDALLEAEALSLSRRRPAREAALRAAVARFADYQDLRPL